MLREEEVGEKGGGMKRETRNMKRETNGGEWKLASGQRRFAGECWKLFEGVCADGLLFPLEGFLAYADVDFAHGGAVDLEEADGVIGFTFFVDGEGAGDFDGVAG